MFNGYLVDCEYICEYCVDDASKYPCVSDEECDCPMNCAECDRPISYRLTEQGVKYVIEKLRQEINIADSHGIPLSTITARYYEGCPAWMPLHDWAKDLQYYDLNDEQQKVLDEFFEKFVD